MNNCNRVWRRYTVPEPRSKNKGVIKRLGEGLGPIMLVYGLLVARERVVSIFSEKPTVEERISGLEKKVERVPAKVVGHFTCAGVFLITFGSPESENVHIKLQGWFQTMSSECRGTNSLLFAHMLLGLGNAKNISFDLDSIEYWDHSEDLDNYMKYGLYFTIGAAGVRADVTRCR
ncbi:hypothetical protein POM88_054827 [Heracleum sosnowskyi]|uniref:Uncharacterized protein n=1 Tax=Heracleum sosnowskyi TaxID=360622 RepID=A0AAD8GM89_9APIA|nr:hypothetical protein POM88_054823 [Heracleum sosnowskyi]KAK1349222.1 hypothetical protein POM88_054824 [Heracleum sosnowskyi]KAK1349225.1 hypothetical protein POM88_054827 [Heracleum sosnowskyi]